MNIPSTEQPGGNNPGFPDMEVPVSNAPPAPAVLYLQELRQKRDTFAENTVYNCYTVTEGGNLLIKRKNDFFLN